MPIAGNPARVATAAAIAKRVMGASPLELAGAVHLLSIINSDGL
jgi:hypothetical protein